MWCCFSTIFKKRVENFSLKLKSSHKKARDERGLCLSYRIIT
ncbi:hypothetical protein CUS_5213 [Ruminococcus albus 8]|uniref:Uncharacterized protein n=1 Tax=Ruminococcus albus 8 TaxID=246199 RepID=E9SE57_RUMAL|nr:hypothetical protein CUS_5213 [Ruminococcus albus 8]